MRLRLLALLALSVLVSLLPARCQAAGPITAIDVALEPGPALKRRAVELNARLRKVYPRGFALDATHHPHVTILQRYVQTADLERVYAAVGKVLSTTAASQLELKAVGLQCGPWGGTGIAIMTVEPTDGLRQLQGRIEAAVAPYTVSGGGQDAYVTGPDGVNRPTIDYVETFVPKATGQNYRPHVTIGLGPVSYLRRLAAQPFQPLTALPTGVVVYQLGNFGTARKPLRAFKL